MEDKSERTYIYFYPPDEFSPVYKRYKVFGGKIASSTQFWWFNKENKIQLERITKVVPVL